MTPNNHDSTARFCKQRPGLDARLIKQLQIAYQAIRHSLLALVEVHVVLVVACGGVYGKVWVEGEHERIGVT